MRNRFHVALSYVFAVNIFLNSPDRTRGLRASVTPQATPDACTGLSAANEATSSDAETSTHGSPSNLFKKTSSDLNSSSCASRPCIGMELPSVSKAQADTRLAAAGFDRSNLASNDTAMLAPELCPTISTSSSVEVSR